MTRYLDVLDLKRLMAIIEPERMMADMAKFIGQDFLRWDSYQKSPRTANHSSEGVIELMPVSDTDLFAFKYVNGHPKNPLRQLSTVMAFGVLADVSTGYPVLLSELTIATALRTAATSVLAASVLARHGSRSMAVIGNGAQSEFQIIAFMSQLGIDEIRAYDVDKSASAKLVANLQPFIKAGRLRVTVANSAREAAEGADIITTITADKTNATIVHDDMVKPGMHLNAVGGDCPGKTELAPSVLEKCTVVVEYEPQTRTEGELQQMPPNFPVSALWKILAGSEQGRSSPEQVTLFDSVGFALEDLSALRYLNEVSTANDIGQKIEIVPIMRDPKDLWGCAMDLSCGSSLTSLGA